MIFNVLAACLLLHNVTVIDPSVAAVRPASDVLIRDGRITTITGKSAGGAPLSAACEQKDLTGKFLLPGFIDMHAHLLAHAWDEKGNLRPRFDRPAIEQMLRTLLAFGVTTVRDPGSETEAAVTFRKLVAAGVITGPTIFTAGRIINASRFDPEPFMPVRNADDVRREIRYQVAAGVDVIKIYASMRPELVRVAIEEAHAAHVPIIGHLQATTWTDAANLGIDGIEHAAPWSAEYLPESQRSSYRGSLFDRVIWLEHIDPAPIAEMVQALARNHVMVDPTLIAMHTKFFGNDARWLDNPDNALVPPLHRAGWNAFTFTKDWTADQYRQAQAAWPRLLALTKQMFDGGVTMVVGTDMPTPWIVPGASEHDEMVLLHDAGIPTMDILKMATSNAAAALHRNDVGAIRSGMRDDLVILARNPLDDIRNTRTIVTVFHDGIEYDPATLLHR